MGRNIYFTEQEILQMLSYINEAMDILGTGEECVPRVESDLENGLGSALRKLYKGKEGEAIYKEYGTKRKKK